MGNKIRNPLFSPCVCSSEFSFDLILQLLRETSHLLLSSDISHCVKPACVKQPLVMSLHCFKNSNVSEHLEIKDVNVGTELILSVTVSDKNYFYITGNHLI